MNRKILVATQSLFVAAIMMSPRMYHSAFSNYVQCDKAQKKCIVADSALTFGDKVGFFDRKGMIRAVGQVKGNEGARRQVKVIKRYGKIARGTDVALLNSDIKSIKQIPDFYHVYNPLKKDRIGFGVATTSTDNGDFQKGTEFNIFYQRNFSKSLSFGINTSHQRNSGDITRLHYQKLLDTQTMTTNAFSIYPTIGIHHHQTKLVSFKGQLGAGISLIAADISGDESLMEDQGFEPSIHNGLRPYVKGLIGVSLNLKSFSIDAEMAKSQLDEASQTSLGLGLSKSL